MKRSDGFLYSHISFWFIDFISIGYFSYPFLWYRYVSWYVYSQGIKKCERMIEKRKIKHPIVRVMPMVFPLVVEWVEGWVKMTSIELDFGWLIDDFIVVTEISSLLLRASIHRRFLATFGRISPEIYKGAKKNRSKSSFIGIRTLKYREKLCPSVWRRKVFDIFGRVPSHPVGFCRDCGAASMERD